MSSSSRESGGVSGPSEDNPISYDDCFELLSNHRRRYTLHHLKQRENGTELGELAEQVAAWENEIPKEEISYDQRKRVYTSLQQVHLPRMDDMDVIKFDDREGTVTMGPAAQELDIYMEIVSGQDIPWSAFYTGLAVLNLGVVVLAALGIPPLAWLSPIGASVFVVTTFLVASLAHLYLTRAEMQLGNPGEPPETDR